MTRKLVYTKNRFAGLATKPAAPVKRRGSKRRRESALESWCVKWARDRNIQVAKLTELIGIPDRVFFTPRKLGGPVVAEFKDPGGKGVLSSAQAWHVAKLREQGYVISTIDSKEEFLRLMLEKGIG